MFATLLPSLFLAVFPALAANPPDWQQGKDFRHYKVDPGAAQRDGFTKIAAEQSSITFTNTLSERLVALNRVTENGSGVALGDVDGDGWCDIYFCRLEGPNALYRNLGNWKFEDITALSGTACDGQLSTGAVLADLDGDGDLDLLVNSIAGGTREFLNDGKGVFHELQTGRLNKTLPATSMALGDIDRDGDLDLYAATYRNIVYKDEFPPPRISAQMVNGRIKVTPEGRFVALGARGGSAELVELAERDYVYMNMGGGTFAPVSWTSGNFLDALGKPLEAPRLDWGLSVMIRDLNGDFLPDIIVCNDFFYSPDQFWIQQPGMKFREISLEALPKISLASMAVDVADINRDGFDDIFVVEMLGRDAAFRQTHRDNVIKAEWNRKIHEPGFRPEVPRNTLFLNRGDGSYAEIAEFAGVDASEWSWGALFLDVDLDGYEDLIIPTGHNHDVQNADVLRGLNAGPDTVETRMANLSKFGKLKTPIVAFHNDGHLHFTPKEKDWGLGEPGIANGMAMADLDNDGDFDLVANRLNQDALLLKNNSSAPRVAVRLRGLGANTRGIGAKIRFISGGIIQSQEMIAGSRYLSGDDSVRVFAALDANATCEVLWPNGTMTRHSNLAPNAVYEFAQTAGLPPVPASPKPAPLFRDNSDLLAHVSNDPPFDDFERQPLLPYSLSSQGPGVAVYDLDQDGWEDIVIGAGRGGRMAILRNNQEGVFTNELKGYTRSTALEDQLGLAIAAVFENGPSILSANSNYESASRATPSVEILSEGHTSSLGGAGDCPGGLQLADFDRDGDLDLFVTGRVLPGKYPAPASCRIYKNTGKAFELDDAGSEVFKHAGIAGGAAVVDFDLDGWPDLALACELGPLKLFKNEKGKFREVTAAFDLDKHTGWWTSVLAGDLDNDGRFDLVAGNWGSNNKYARFMEKPPRVYFGDLDGNGVFDLLETFHDPVRQKYLPWIGLETAREQFPALGERFPTFASYSVAGVEDLFPGLREHATVYEITCLESSLFLNRGSHFERVPLPAEAQFAPVFGMACADFNGDGNEDLFLAQNLSDTRWETGPLNSGAGVLLQGDGRGGFVALNPAQSGVAVYGEGRGAASGDFNNDGRPDLVAVQNNGPSRLFINERGTPGIRIKFAGPPGNRDATGTTFRWTADGRSGPLRQIGGSGGWLSQSGLCQIVPRLSSGGALHVNWPGGKTESFNLPADAAELKISFESGLQIIRK